MLMDEGYEESRNWPYAYACYDNGLEIGQAHRDIYRQLGDDAVRFGDPLVTTGENSFLSWIMSGGQMVGDA
jgi:hypothetical protein